MPRNSDTPLDHEIAQREAERTDPVEALVHRLQASLRDASTMCEIDGYDPKVGTALPGEWHVRIGKRRFRLILVELP